MTGMTMAAHPDKKPVGRVVNTVKAVYGNPPTKVKNGYITSWSDEYFKWFWRRVGVTLILLGVPTALVWLTMWSLLGYAMVLAVPIALAVAKNKTDGRYSTRKAYGYFSQLKSGWRDHGEVFYRQIWSHDCSGNEKQYGGCYCVGTCKCKKYLSCTHCDKRLVELTELYDSQKSVEDKTQDEVSASFFEASKEFRLAAAETMQDKQAALMKEISDSAADPVKKKLLGRK